MELWSSVRLLDHVQEENDYAVVGSDHGRLKFRLAVNEVGIVLVEVAETAHDQNKVENVGPEAVRAGCFDNLGI